VETEKRPAVFGFQGEKFRGEEEADMRVPPGSERKRVPVREGASWAAGCFSYWAERVPGVHFVFFFSFLFFCFLISFVSFAN
jgi:hypothetical protein